MTNECGIHSAGHGAAPHYIPGIVYYKKVAHMADLYTELERLARKYDAELLHIIRYAVQNVTLAGLRNSNVEKGAAAKSVEIIALIADGEIRFADALEKLKGLSGEPRNDEPEASSEDAPPDH